MSRGNCISIWRPVAVWCGVTSAAGAAALAAPDSWAAVAGARGSDDVGDLVVAVCATGLLLALVWLWVITTVTVTGLLARGPRAGSGGAGGATRRLVLLACGAAVVAGTSVPALADGGDAHDLLVGLAMPERAVAPPARHHPAAPAEPAVAATRPSPGTYVVRPGDTLWSIATDHPAESGSVDQRWRAIWRANRDVVGGDPDLIFPGQALRLPTFPTTQDPHSDGDRS